MSIEYSRVLTAAHCVYNPAPTNSLLKRNSWPAVALIAAWTFCAAESTVQPRSNCSEI